MIATWWRRTTYSRVLRGRNFRLLWIGQLTSNLGTYAYIVALSTTLSARMEGAELARTVALMLAVQAGTSAFVGLLIAGPLVDRFSRKRLMIMIDVVRCIAVLSLLFGAAPLLHLAIIGGILGAADAMFDPSLGASLPSVVDDDEVVPANAVITGTFYAGVMIGPALGAVAIAIGGVTTTFGLNAVSFAISAALIARTTLPTRTRPTEGRVTPLVLARDLGEGATHLIRSRLAVGIMAVMCLVVAVAGAQATLQVVFVREVLVPGLDDDGARAAALAALTTAWGSGMLVGCIATPFLVRHLPRERLIPLVVAVAGVCVVYGSRSAHMLSVALLWTAAGAMCGITNVSYESLLQERTPDAFRGRVLSIVEAAQEGAYFLGLAAAVLFASASAGHAMQTIGVAFTLTGVLASFVLRPAQPRDAAPEPAAIDAAGSLARPGTLPGSRSSFPEWLSLDTPWVVSRDADVVGLDVRWPLVPSDWPRLLADLDRHLTHDVVAIMLPVQLPRGSTLEREALEDLWHSMLERGLLVQRRDRRAGAVHAGAVAPGT